MNVYPEKEIYVCIFPDLEDFHLVKDVGMIPYTMGRFFNFQSFIVTKNNNKNFYHLIEDYLKLDFFVTHFNSTKIGIILYLISKSKNINVLQLFHLQDTLNVLIYGLTFKILNKKGSLYVKMDADDYTFTILEKKNLITRRIQKIVIKYLVDVVSIETKKGYDKMTSMNLISPKKLLYLPNGVTIKDKDNRSFNKENIILNVGRLGTEQKATEVLLEAFAKTKNKNWKLILIGDVETSFQRYITDYFKKHPHLHGKVIFRGYISNREEIYDYYSRSKIFCFPSRWEGFSIALIEAAFYGNYILSTDVGGAKDIIDATKYGELVKKDDVYLLASKLQDLISNWDKYKQNPLLCREIVKKKFNWIDLCQKLNEKLNDSKKNLRN